MPLRLPAVEPPQVKVQDKAARAGREPDRQAAETGLPRMAAQSHPEAHRVGRATPHRAVTGSLRAEVQDKVPPLARRKVVGLRAGRQPGPLDQDWQAAETGLAEAVRQPRPAADRASRVALPALQAEARGKGSRVARGNAPLVARRKVIS
ncbi:hypothetical protein ACIP5Y_45405 [Nocardia sp. NPDC088792]|uniref:hypothetical protein n=1 Tax=Nocardia sp. NPDC088792 TaxID=3364332 RepID=UPI00381A73D6